MSSSGTPSEETYVLEEVVESVSSGEDPPMSEWSSLEIAIEEENQKKLLMSKGLYSPGSGEVCAKYIHQSDSDILRHEYYRYPAVLDPGIKDALFAPMLPVTYGNDGADLYLSLCFEMNICPVRLFHRNLKSNEINLSYYGVNPNGIRAMAIALQYNQHVRRFNLTDNFLHDDACYHLDQLLYNNVTLQELILAGCRIGISGLTRLVDNLKVNKTLVYLDISKNCLGDEGGVVLAKKIDEGVLVPKLNLSRNDLGRQTSIVLAEALEFKSDYLTHLNLSYNNLFVVPCTVKLLTALSQCTKLQELNIASNSLAGEKIADAIKNIISLPTLEVLNLSSNRFQGEDIQLIVSRLLKAKKLHTLNMSHNPMTPNDTVTIIQKMLKPRVKVQNLLLEGIPVNAEFLAVLEKVKTMKTRTNFSIVHDKALHDWTIKPPDYRKLILNRAIYLGQRDRKRRVDVALFFLKLDKMYTKPLPVKILTDIISAEGVPLDTDLVSEMATAFPGSKVSDKMKTVNLQNVAEYIKRLWPEKKLPPTPPEPEPEPEIAPPPPKKGLKTGKK